MITDNILLLWDAFGAAATLSLVVLLIIFAKYIKSLIVKNADSSTIILSCTLFIVGLMLGSYFITKYGLVWFIHS